MRSSVLPDPAGAWTMKERPGWSARSRSARSGASAIHFPLAGRAHGQAFAHAAKRLLAAVLARLRPILRVDVRIPLRVAGADFLDLDPPLRLEIIPIPVLLRGRAMLLDGRDARERGPAACEPVEAEV